MNTKTCTILALKYATVDCCISNVTQVWASLVTKTLVSSKNHLTKMLIQRDIVFFCSPINFLGWQDLKAKEKTR